MAHSQTRYPGASNRRLELYCRRAATIGSCLFDQSILQSHPFTIARLLYLPLVYQRPSLSSPHALSCTRLIFHVVSLFWQAQKLAP